MSLIRIKKVKTLKIFIEIFGVLLAFWAIHGRFLFYSEVSIFQKRDYLRSLSWLSGIPVWGGPETIYGSQTPGPFFYLLNAIPLSINKSVESIIFWNYLLGGLACVCLWFLMKRRFGALAALFATTLYLFDLPIVYIHLRNLNPSYAPLFNVLVFFGLVEAFAWGTKRTFLFAMICLSLLIQLHMSYVAYLAIVAVLYVASRFQFLPRIKWQTIVSGLLCIFISVIPFYLFPPNSSDIHFGSGGLLTMSWPGESGFKNPMYWLMSLEPKLLIRYFTSRVNCVPGIFLLFSLLFISFCWIASRLKLTPQRIVDNRENQTESETYSFRVLMLMAFTSFIVFLPWMNVRGDIFLWRTRVLSHLTWICFFAVLIARQISFLAKSREGLRILIAVIGLCGASLFIIYCIEDLDPGSIWVLKEVTLWTPLFALSIFIFCLVLYILASTFPQISNRNQQMALKGLFVLMVLTWGLICTSSIKVLIASRSYERQPYLMPCYYNFSDAVEISEKIYEMTGWSTEEFHDRVFVVGKNVETAFSHVYLGLLRDKQLAIDHEIPQGFFVLPKTPDPVGLSIEQKLRSYRVAGSVLTAIKLKMIVTWSPIFLKNSILIPYVWKTPAQPIESFHNEGSTYFPSQEDRWLEKFEMNKDQEFLFVKKQSHDVTFIRQFVKEAPEIRFAVHIQMQASSDHECILSAHLFGRILSQSTPWASQAIGLRLVKPYIEIESAKGNKLRFNISSEVGFREEQLQGHLWSGNLLAPLNRHRKIACDAAKILRLGYTNAVTYKMMKLHRLDEPQEFQLAEFD